MGDLGAVIRGLLRGGGEFVSSSESNLLRLSTERMRASLSLSLLELGWCVGGGGEGAGKGAGLGADGGAGLGAGGGGGRSDGIGVGSLIALENEDLSNRLPGKNSGGNVGFGAK